MKIKKVHLALRKGDNWVYGDRSCTNVYRPTKKPWRASNVRAEITCERCIAKINKGGQEYLLVA